MAAADDLFGLLTNAQRIPLWTRAPAEVRRSTLDEIRRKRTLGTFSLSPRLIPHTRSLEEESRANTFHSRQARRSFRHGR